MKVAAGIVATVSFMVAALLLAWGGWLVGTDDPDGGRHPVGALMLGVGVVAVSLGLVSSRWVRRR
jgi:hypothetical protein